MAAESLDEWFVRAVLPHEAALTRYLQRHWRGPAAEVSDLRQEALTRVYAAARKERPTHAKSFLFTTARRLILDHVRRGRVVEIEAVMDLEQLTVSVDEVWLDAQISARQELKILQRALDALPGKCRDVVELRRVYGFSQRETAERLGLTEAAVEGHIQRGVRRLAEALRGVSEIGAVKARAKRDKEKERS